MKIVRTSLLAGASLLAMTAHASADPISIGFLLFSGPLGSVFSFSALVGFATLLPTIAAVGLSLGSALLRGGGAQQQVDPGQYRSTFESSEASEVNAIGRCLLGGLKVFGNTKTVNRWRLVAHARGPLVAAEEYRLGGQAVVVEDDGAVSSPPYSRPGGSYIYLLTKDGDGTETAWSYLMDDFPSLWTADHRVRGIAQTIGQYISPGLTTEAGIAKFNKLYQGGEPELAVLGRWNTAYDPREVAHDPEDPDTWEWTQNGPLCVARIMLNYPELTVDDFDWDDLAIEADKADVPVATLTGTEPRSRCSGVWLSESIRGDTMQDVLDSVGCEISTSDVGKIRIRLIDDTPTSEGTLAAKYTTDWSWKSGPDAVERPNLCRITFYSAERNYEMADIDLSDVAWARVQSEIDRYGEKVFDIKLPFCPSASQAQRIGRRMFLQARADTGVNVAGWDGLWAWGRLYANVEFPDLDESPLCKLAPPRIDDENGQVEIPYLVWPQALIDEPWNPATMEAPAPEEVPPLAYESDVATPTVVDAILVQYPGGAYEMRFDYGLPETGTLLEAAYRTYTGGNPSAWAGMEEYFNPTYAWVAGGAAGQLADFRVRQFNDEEDGSAWSPILQTTLAINNTTPAAPTGGIGVPVRIASLSAVQIKLWRRYRPSGAGSYGSWEELDAQDVRPGVEYTFTDPSPPLLDVDGEAVNYQLIAYTSNGTAGPPLDIESVFTDPDP